MSNRTMDREVRLLYVLSAIILLVCLYMMTKKPKTPLPDQVRPDSIISMDWAEANGYVCDFKSGQYHCVK